MVASLRPLVTVWVVFIALGDHQFGILKMKHMGAYVLLEQNVLLVVEVRPRALLVNITMTQNKRLVNNAQQDFTVLETARIQYHALPGIGARAAPKLHMLMRVHLVHSMV